MTTIRRFSAGASVILAATLGFACDEVAEFAAPEMAPAGPSQAFSAWEPGEFDTCTKAIHDQYAVVGDDGKLYPTWHPSVDLATGCTFGHEHGRDPRGSDLYETVGFIPFGRANEAAGIAPPHPGFKIEWENDVAMQFDLGDAGSDLFAVTCDVMFEIHQGSSGGGRFVQPQHEVAHHARCTDGTEIHVQFLATIGRAGQFIQSCSGYQNVRVVVDPDHPAPSGRGRRFIPDQRCMDQYILKGPGGRTRWHRMHEIWETSEAIRAAGGRVLASLDPYFKVLNPVRYYDPDLPSLLANSVDLCYPTPEGLSAQGGECDDLAGATGVAWNHPDSPFDGAHREVRINTIRVQNADGPEVWFTDAWGESGSPEPFAGSVRQWLSRIDNSTTPPAGGNIGRDRYYGGDTVHPPN